jgi:uncharacterized membrane protein
VTDALAPLTDPLREAVVPFTICFVCLALSVAIGKWEKSHGRDPRGNIIGASLAVCGFIFLFVFIFTFIAASGGAA